MFVVLEKCIGELVTDFCCRSGLDDLQYVTLMFPEYNYYFVKL